MMLVLLQVSTKKLQNDVRKTVHCRERKQVFIGLRSVLETERESYTHTHTHTHTHTQHDRKKIEFSSQRKTCFINYIAVDLGVARGSAQAPFLLHLAI